MTRLKRVLKHLDKQDWTAHAVNFFGIGFAAFLGVWVANLNEAGQNRKEVQALFFEFNTSAETAAEGVQSSQDYFARSQASAIKAIQILEGQESANDETLLIELVRATQIVAPPLQLKYYVDAFGADGLAKIENIAIRREAAVFFAYDTSLFEIPNLITDYRRFIQASVPDDIFLTYSQKCFDVPNGNGGWYAHNKSCMLDLDPERAALIVTELKSELGLIPLLRNHIADLRLLGGSIHRYKCNSLIFANSIAREHKDVLDSISSEACGI